MTPLRLTIAGAGGRMGREILAAACADDTLTIQAGFVRPGSTLVGRDLGTLIRGSALGVTASTIDTAPEILRDTDLLIDFSRPGATATYAQAAACAGIPFLTGTTGLTAEDRAAIAQAAATIPTLVAANTSVGLTVLLQLLPTLVQALGTSYDLEIVETHHRHKADAPSGTALTIANALAAARASALDEHVRYGREGHAPRATGEIGIHAIRAGAAAGEHRIILASEGEQIEILHRANSRSTYAAGALRAARWLHNQAPGTYTMAEVL